MKKQTYKDINKDINEINNKLRTETSANKINNLIKKREDLVSGYMSVGNIACGTIPLPLKPEYGGTGLSMIGTFPVTLGGTGHSAITANGILVGNNKLPPTVQLIDGNVVDTESMEIIKNKMFDDSSYVNINLQTCVSNILPISKGGTGLSSLKKNTILGNNDYILHDLIFFSVFNNGNTQIITENPTRVLNWNKLYDQSNLFDVDTGTFTVPIDGYYMFAWSVGYNSTDSGFTAYNNFFKTTLVTPNKNFETIKIIPNNENNSIIVTTGSITIKLQKGNTVYLTASINDDINNSTPSTLANSNVTWLNACSISFCSFTPLNGFIL